MTYIISQMRDILSIINKGKLQKGILLYNVKPLPEAHMDMIYFHSVVNEHRLEFHNNRYFNGTDL